MPSGPCAQLDKLRRRRGSTWGHDRDTDEGKRCSKRAGQDFAHACCVAGLGPARGSSFQGGRLIPNIVKGNSSNGLSQTPGIAAPLSRCRNRIELVP